MALAKNKHSTDEIESIITTLQDRRFTGDGIGESDQAMLAYADKLTRQPGDMNQNDIDQLRARGFGDRAIHDIAAITGYFAFVNRIADGLGVELET